MWRVWKLSIFMVCITVSTLGHRGGNGQQGWGHGNQGHGNQGHGNQGHGNQGWGGGGWNNNYQPTQFGGGGWPQQQPQYFGQNQGFLTPSPVQQWHNVQPPEVNCPRPHFNDGIAQLIIEKCDTESSHKTCWDSESPIPQTWKVALICAKGNVRIRKPSSCSSNGDWTPQLPDSCASIFEKYALLAETTLTDKYGKVPLTILKPRPSHEEHSEEYTNPTAFINTGEKQCPMIRMQLSENFIFSCFKHHQSSIETTQCINLKHVDSGTIAVLRCKPPFFNKDGNYSEWICDNGAWNGNFNEKLKCHYSDEPIKLKPKSKPTATPTFKTTTTTTPAPTPRSTTTAQPKPERTTKRTTTEDPVAEVYGWITPKKTTTLRPGLQYLLTTPSTTTFSPLTSSSTFPPLKIIPVPITSRRPITRRTTTTTTPPILSTTELSIPSQEIKCPPLKPRTGMVLECVSKTKATPTISEQVFVNGCDIPQPVGAEAKYSCTKFFEVTGGLASIYRKCKEDGTWAGSAENFNCVPECGRKNEVFIPLITFGTPSFRGEWPWHTAIFRKESRVEDWQYICGGTLISSRTVMTAAHCLVFPESSKVRSISNFRFDLGRFELENLDDIIQTRQVESIHIHPSYSPFGYDSDIGIVILKESTDTGYHVRPICFPQSVNTAQEEIMLAEGSIGTVIGWGLTEEGKVAQNLQTGKLRVVGPVECSQETKTVGGGRLQIKSTTYCAAPGLNGDNDKIVNVCSGDSGGGMYFPSQSSDSSGSSKWFLQGIVSLGIGDENNKCKPSQFSFFTRVGRYSDWMIRVMSENDAL